MKKGQPLFKIKEVKEPVESPAVQETNVAAGTHGIIVNSSLVSVKDYASDTAPVKEYLQNGEEVEIDGELNGFYMIRFGKTRRLGYISRNFCREVKRDG